MYTFVNISEKVIAVFLRVGGNPRLCVNATSCPTSGKSSSVGIVAGAVVGVLVAVAVAVGAALYHLKKKKKASKDTPEKTRKIVPRTLSHDVHFEVSYYSMNLMDHHFELDGSQLRKTRLGEPDTL